MKARKRTPPPLNKRRAARFAAVQALYQADNGDQTIGRVVAEFKAHRLPGILEPLGADLPPVRVDAEWFAAVAEGVDRHLPVIDARIEASLSSGWTVARLDEVLRAVLRAGAFELMERIDVPVRVVINEYIEVAKLFFEGEEAGFVNAVLDRLAPVLRSGDKAL
ncbi:MAG: transcription antitermination factor NusB [Geminicoccaceae bacterium]|nr:transcription antitermination factor NusB [Geminicoccaceae bacterium]